MRHAQCGKEGNAQRTVLLVDADTGNQRVLSEALRAEYCMLLARDWLTALEFVRERAPDLVLLNMMLPGASGPELNRMLERREGGRTVPVIFLTDLGAEEDEYKTPDMNAGDYLAAPFNPDTVREAVRVRLLPEREQASRDTQLQVIQSLKKAAEYRDVETGGHVAWISHYARCLAKAVGYGDDAADELMHAVPMHDVGKIGIPDAILRKPGKLDAAEMEIMRQHPVIGARIIGEHPPGLLRTAATVALRHHEKWDGSGYPDGLAGAAIPIEARIVAVVDVFDALTSTRPYKSSWTVEDAVVYIERESGRHFDPVLVEAFKRCLPDILAIRRRWADS
jgi:putative two-component system response regulator